MRLLALAMATLGALAASGLAVSPARAANPAASDVMKLIDAAGGDSASAAGMIPSLRSLLANSPDSTYASMLRQTLVRALVSSRAPTAAIAASADTAGRLMVGSYVQRVGFYASVAQVLADRGDGKRAATFGRKALANLPAEDQTPGLRGFVLANLGLALFQSGKTDSAIACYLAAVPITPDSQEVLRNLGAAYAKAGKKNDAVSAYIRALSVFPAKDTTGTAGLQAAYRSQHGSLDGLDATLTEARKASREQVALRPRRRERPAPPWTLQDVDGKEVKSDAFAGKVMVVDFWGSWCGPCREELPLFQRLYNKYKGRVAFIGMNWEQPGVAEERVKRAREYVNKSNFTFPVVLDHERQASEAFGINAFPTMYMVDKTGKIRYRNIGVAPGIEQIVTDQIESLLQ